MKGRDVFVVLSTSYGMGLATCLDVVRCKLLLSVDVHIRSLSQPTQCTLKAGAVFIVVIELVSVTTCVSRKLFIEHYVTLHDVLHFSGTSSSYTMPRTQYRQYTKQ